MKTRIVGIMKSRLLAVVMVAAIPLGASAATVGLNWIGAGSSISDGGGAFGVPLTGWNNLSGASGSAVISPPSGGAFTVTWDTGGGAWQSGGATFPGFSAGENQVLSGNLYAGVSYPSGARAITITISGMDVVATGSYQLRLMSAIDGPANGAFRPASLSTGETLSFDTLVHSGNPFAATTTNLTLSGDSFSFTIANDSSVEGGSMVRAEISGMVLTFTPAPAPVFTTQPQSVTVADGGSVDFSAAATGSGALSYQWQLNQLDLDGKTSPTLHLTGLSTTDAGKYRVKVTDGSGRFSYSSEATLTIATSSTAMVYDWSTVSSFNSTGAYPAGVGLFFDVAPGTSISVKRLGAAMPDATINGVMTVQLYEVSSATVLATVTFDSTNDTSSPTGILYQWLKPVSGLVLGSGSYAVIQYGGTYANIPSDYTVNTLGGAVTHAISKWGNGPGGPGHLPSNNDGINPKYAGPTFEAQVSGAPGITRQPKGGSFAPGVSATLSVIAGGSSPLTYQWQKNGNNLGGATTATLQLSSVGSTDTADYRVIVANSFGSVTSLVAHVEIAGTPTLGVQLNPGIVIHGTVGLHYRVNWCDALTVGSPWQLLQDIPSLATAPYVVIDPEPVSATNKRFYQAVLVP